MPCSNRHKGRRAHKTTRTISVDFTWLFALTGAKTTDTGLTIVGEGLCNGACRADLFVSRVRNTTLFLVSHCSRKVGTDLTAWAIFAGLTSCITELRLEAFNSHGPTFAHTTVSVDITSLYTTIVVGMAHLRRTCAVEDALF